jgi:acetoin utilization protein AcuB
MVIGEIMTKDPITAKSTATVAEAMSTLHDLDVRHLPIVDGGELVGIISDRDVRGFAEADMFDPDAQDELREKLKTPISEIMAADLSTLDRESEVSEAIDLMLEERVGAIPVIDRDTRELVGIVSYIDVLRALRDSV